MAEVSIRNLGAIQSQKQVNGADVAQALRDVLTQLSTVKSDLAALKAQVAALQK